MTLELYIAGQIIHADLVKADEHITNNGIKGMEGVAHLKSALTAAANLVDYQRSITFVYKRSPNLSVNYKSNEKNFEFAKYLRNRVVGHINTTLLQQAIRWKPELRYLPEKMSSADVAAVVNLWVIETAINTYVGVDGEHKIFNGDTDLQYPPDWDRFMEYLEVTVRGGIDFLVGVLEEMLKDIPILDPKSLDLELWLGAGSTDFKYIPK